MSERLRKYYDVLGVSPGASLEEVRSAYRRLAKEFHPDMTSSPDSERFRAIREAYEFLTDSEKRNTHGRGGAARAPRPSVRSRRSEIEIVLSPQEAARGGELRFEVGVESVCPQCQGTGRGFFLSCPDCRGVGLRFEYRLVKFRIPPGIEHGGRVRAYAGAGLGYITATIAIALRVV